MVNSRDLNDLREDVRANCRVFLERCAEEGLNVLVTQTLRDDEYQKYLYSLGRTREGSIVTNGRRTTFHGAGLAFDICKNVKGAEYSDSSFFRRCGRIGKEIGFTWGGDWRTLVDYPHFQWDEGGKYQFSRTKQPAAMPQKGDEMITTESIAKMDDAAILALANRIQSVLSAQEQSGSVAEELAAAVALGITDGTRPKAFCTRAQAAVMVKRAMER